MWILYEYMSEGTAHANLTIDESNTFSLGRTNPISRISRRDNPKISRNLLPKRLWLEEKLPARTTKHEDRARWFQVEATGDSLIAWSQGDIDILLLYNGSGCIDR